VILNALGLATDIQQAFTVDNSGWKGGVGGCKLSLFAVSQLLDQCRMRVPLKLLHLCDVSEREARRLRYLGPDTYRSASVKFDDAFS
jgi:hypothetical protein